MQSLRPVLRRASLIRAASGVSLLALWPRLAGASGLHQAPGDAATTLMASFAGLWALGLLACVAGALLWLLRSFAARGSGVRGVFEVCGALTGFFGAAAMLLSRLPGVLGIGGESASALLGPLALMLLCLVALVVALDRRPGGYAHGGRRGWPGKALATALWIALLALFVGVPLAAAFCMVWGREAVGLAGMGIDHLLAARYWSIGCVTGRGGCGSAINSIALGVVVAALAGILGLALALYAHSADRALRKWVALLACLPMITPPFLVGLGLAQVFGQSGVVSVVLEAALGLPRSRWFFGASGVVMAQVLVFFPIVYFLVLNALDTLGRTQIDAAKFLGASDFDVLRTLTFPAIRDSLAVALLIVFVETLSDVGNPLIIGGKLRVLSTELFYSSSMDLSASEMTGVPALLLTAIALCMAALKDSVSARARRGRRALLPACDEPGPAAGSVLPRPLRVLCGALLLMTLSILLAVYVLLGVGAFSEAGMVTGGFTLDNFARGFGVTFGAGQLLLTGSAWDSLIASLSCAFIVAPLSGLAGMSMVWILQRGGVAGARVIESLSSYLLCVPSVVVGAGFLLVFAHLGLSNLGAWSLILLAMLIRNFAVCMRFGSVALRRIGVTLSDVSSLCGASSLATFTHIVAPLLRSTFVVCVGYGFVRSLTMLGSVLLLSSAENQVATTYMIDRIGIGEHGVAMAYGVVLAAAIALVLLAARALLSARLGAVGVATAMADLKAAVILAQKDHRRSRVET
jgi:iron(III) transport system permease protein